MAIDLDSFKSLFLQTAQENINVLKTAVEQLAKNNSATAYIEQIHRSFHSLKSECGIMGFKIMSEVCLKNQKLFEEIANDINKLTPTVFETVAADILYLQDSIENIKLNGKELETMIA